MNDSLNRIFLKFCLHIAVSIATIVAWYSLNLIATGDNFYIGLWICIFVTNCTTLILSKLNRILEQLPKDETNEIPEIT